MICLGALLFTDPYCHSKTEAGQNTKTKKATKWSNRKARENAKNVP